MKDYLLNSFYRKLITQYVLNLKEFRKKNKDFLSREKEDLFVSKIKLFLVVIWGLGFCGGPFWVTTLKNTVLN